MHLLEKLPQPIKKQKGKKYHQKEHGTRSRSKLSYIYEER
jgi:hypothetical protein